LQTCSTFSLLNEVCIIGGEQNDTRLSSDDDITILELVLKRITFYKNLSGIDIINYKKVK